MSRIGKMPIEIPQGVSVINEGEKVLVKGPKGELVFEMKKGIEIDINEKEVIVKKPKINSLYPFWGTSRAIINNMIKGVTDGFKKQLELHGVGYKMTLQGKKLVFNLGFSHPIEMEIPEGITISIDKNVLTVEGLDKYLVGQVAANIKALKKVEPYKGKGFRYVGEQFIKKEGKRAGGIE